MFEEYLSTLDEADRAALAHLIALVAEEAPEAEEGQSYGAPAFRYRGRPLIGFAAHKAHIAVYPFSPEVVEAVADRLTGHRLSKGTIRFTREMPLPDDVLADIVKLRMAEIDR